MMLMLGNYRFKVDTAAYQAKNRTTLYRWAKQDLLTVAPALQFIGPGDDTLNIEGVIFPHFKGGLGQLESMRQEAGQGQPLLLVEGSGKVLGRWVIESVTENQSVFEKNGTPQQIEFTLEIRKADDSRNNTINDLAMVIGGARQLAGYFA